MEVSKAFFGTKCLNIFATGCSKANDAEYDAFADLFRYIRTDILNTGAVITMVNLTKKLESFSQSRGIEGLSKLTKKHNSWKTETEFGSNIQICIKIVLERILRK